MALDQHRVHFQVFRFEFIGLSTLKIQPVDPRFRALRTVRNDDRMEAGLFRRLETPPLHTFFLTYHI